MNKDKTAHEWARMRAEYEKTMKRPFPEPLNPPPPPPDWNGSGPELPRTGWPWLGLFLVLLSAALVVLFVWNVLQWHKG